MSTEIITKHEGGMPYSDANLRCDFCGVLSEPQGAAGVGSSECAASGARAHAAVVQKWTTTTVPVVEGKKRYALLRDKCQTCSTATPRGRLVAARAAIAAEKGIPEAEVHGWEAGMRAWSGDTVGVEA